MLQSLIDQARQGDAEAFDALVRATGDRCLGIAYRILRDPHLAEDAVQAAFVAAWRDLPSLRDPDRFEAWLHRLLTRACQQEARRVRRHASTLRAIPVDHGQVAAELVTNVDRDELERCFGRLSIEQRAVLVFHRYPGLTVPEIAERLGLRQGAVASRLHDAIAAMRAALEADARIPATGRARSA